MGIDFRKKKCIGIKSICRPIAYKDPDIDILMRTIEFSLPAFCCFVVWVVFRPVDYPDFTSLLFPSIPGFMAIAAHAEKKWNNKLKAMAILIIGTAIAQFGCAVLYYEKFLLLAWIFIFTLIIVNYSKFQYSASAAVGWGLLGVFYTPGYFAGLSRSINLFYGGIIAVICVALLSILTCKYRIRLILSRYLEAVIDMHYEVFYKQVSPEKVKQHRQYVLKLAMKANILIISTEYILYKQNLFALRAKSILCTIHALSRLHTANRYLKTAAPEILCEFSNILHSLLVEVLYDIKNGTRIKASYSELNKQFQKTINLLHSDGDSKAVLAIETIINEVSKLNGKKLR